MLSGCLGQEHFSSVQVVLILQLPQSARDQQSCLPSKTLVHLPFVI